ncbi:MAG: Pvc16 family protein [Acidimicrobiales bacterium]
MIHHVDKAFETFLRQQVPLPEASVDVSFRAPEGSWTASVSRPTVDVFLWDVARSSRATSMGLDQRVADNGRRQQRPLLSQVALRYFVTVWAREQRDEHELLGAILRCVLGNDVLPSTLLPPAVAESSCRLILAGDQHRLPPQLWSGAAVKPGLYVEVELGLDAVGWLDRGAPIEQMHLGVVDALERTPPPSPAPRPPLRRIRAGGTLVMEGRPEHPAGAPADGPGTRDVPGVATGGDEADGEGDGEGDGPE